MGFFDRLFGSAQLEPQQQYRPAPQARPQRQLTDDELAVERYRYLLRTAPPETIEQVHAEAFAKLTPEQREQVYVSLAEQAPANERIADDQPQTLARAATRQEMQQPGSMERAFGGGPGGRQGGPSFGGMFAGSLLGTVAGVVVGSAIAQAFLPDPSSFEAGGDAGDAGSGDAGADAGSVEASGADAGGYGDFGGGGDAGGFGDFGGGDFGGDFGF
ncbi:hypothetical protein [Agromyces aerolatus]|uniref:hypothetical protein n=1 Tax=Agromyces sp. LY-1074 TaxID=3074080 RepID=UPI002858E9BF|nr:MULTISPECIES: hypothetical protein [unclassified Agromyces]MDR5699907.1 hypothetical protein [Agromyces sp. LY-1074]MDR5706281.1 hypothetical protein [Agromyces sp. LY-1358]